MAALRSETDGRHGVSSNGVRAAESNGVRATQEQQPGRSRHPHWARRVCLVNDPRKYQEGGSARAEAGAIRFSRPPGFGKTLRQRFELPLEAHRW